MTGHVFISYSHNEASQYVESLSKFLTSANIPVWYDREIITGHRWAHVIRDRIDTCGAFIVIMTPEAEASQWVNREINQAQSTNRAIFPLLLRGERFFTLADLHFEDLRNGAMPSLALVSNLRATLGQRKAVLKPVAQPEPDAYKFQPRSEEARRLAYNGRPSEAIQIMSNVLDEQIRVLGPDSPQTLRTRQDLATYIAIAGQRTDAVRLLRALVIDQSRLLGPKHPDTLDSTFSLIQHMIPDRRVGLWRITEADEYQEAFQLCQQLHVDCRAVPGLRHDLYGATEHLLNQLKFWWVPGV